MRKAEIFGLGWICGVVFLAVLLFATGQIEWSF